MRMADHHPALLVAPMAHHLDIQFIHLLLQGDGDTFALHHRFARGQSLGIELFQHLQAVGRAANQRTQGDGDGQSHHAGARNADSHRILQDIRAQIDLHPFGAIAQHLRRFRAGQGHSDRLRTSNGRNHLPMDQTYNTLFCLLIHTVQCF